MIRGIVAGLALTLIASAAAEESLTDCGTVLSVPEADRLRSLGWAYQSGDERGPTVQYVPLAFHVVRRTNGTGGITPAQICQGLDLLDASYATAHVQFFLIGPIDYIDSDEYYFNINTLSEINALRTTNLVNGAINIYSTPTLNYESGALCGISAFTTSSIQSIAMRDSCMPPGNLSTLPHEVGHYFNLYHTHETAFGPELVDGSNCASAGDVVCDTPADPVLGTANVTAAPACAYTGTATDGNGDPYAPNTRNYLSYSRKECRDHFSAGQNGRLYDTLVNLRPELAFAAPPSVDCNGNSIRDGCDIAQGTATDCDVNGVPDSCQSDCDGDGLIDLCDTPGDIDGDSLVTSNDLAIFISVLIATDLNPTHIQQSNLNCDTGADGRDIPGFVTAWLSS